MNIKTSAILILFSTLLIFLFVYTATSKLLDFTLFKAVLSHSPVIGTWGSIVAILVPVSELVVAALLLFPKSRKLGYQGSLLLMTVFTLYVSYMIFFVSKLPCSCGGVLQTMSWKQHLLFNIFFTAMSFIGLLLCKGIRVKTKQIYLTN